MAAPINRNFVDFFFKYFRWSWRERYVHAAVPSLQVTRDAAATLAAWRLPLFGNDGSIAGSPYLDRIIVSNGLRIGDSVQDTSFRDKTLAYANPKFNGDKAADPRFGVGWETTALTGFTRTRFLAGVPSSILGFVSPATHRDFLPVFQAWANALKSNWGYLLTGSGPDGSAEEPIAFMEPVTGDQVKVWSDPVPETGDTVEIKYPRFLEGSPHVRGTYDVTSVGDGFFIVEIGRDASTVKYHHGGIWRFPTTRFVPFDGSSFITEIIAHQRGYKAHARRGRGRTRKPTIF